MTQAQTPEALRSLAAAVKGWSGITEVWAAPVDDGVHDFGITILGHMNEGGNELPTTEIDTYTHGHAGESLKLAQYYAAANPAAILALLDRIAMLEAAAVKESLTLAQERLRADQMTQRLDMANRLGNDARAELAQLRQAKDSLRAALADIASGEIMRSHCVGPHCTEELGIATADELSSRAAGALNWDDLVAQPSTDVGIPMLAQLSARQAELDGWRLVPELPTLNMLNTAFGICTENGRPVQQMIEAAAGKYAAMLSAAPAPPEREPLTDETVHVPA